MGKSFLALLLVAFGVGGTDTMDPTITIDPHPPVAGQSVTVTFTGTCPATLTMEINPCVGGIDTMDPTITIDPHPPVAGQSVKVTFTGTCPATLTMEINPGQHTSEIDIGEDGTATFIMPDGATYIISDPKGEADPLSGSITPP
jgi:hypothetical protein